MLEPPPRQPDDLDVLLAQKRLSGAEYDAIAQRVLAQAGRPARTRRIALYAAPILAAAAALLLVLLPRTDGLRSKGVQGPGTGLELLCGSGQLDRCEQGQLLTLRVEDVAAPGYLHAWAEPVAGGERIWYFAGDSAVPVTPKPGPQLLDRAVRVGAQHAPGQYRVHMVLAPARLERDALLGATDSAWTAVTTSLEISR